MMRNLALIGSPGRLTVLRVAVLVLLAWLHVAPASASASASATDTDGDTSSPVPRRKPREEYYDDAADAVMRTPYPGLDPRYEGRTLLSALFRRDDCYSNQTSCSGSHCCDESTPTCCGTGCCADGEVCSNGECSVPVVTSTITSTTTTTATASQLETVWLKVDVTSTVDSVTTVTASSLATASDIFYTTTTVVAGAKRELPTGTALNGAAEPDADTDGVGDDELASRLLARRPSLWERFTGRDAPDHADDDEGPVSPFAPRHDPVPWSYQNAARDAPIARRSSSTVTSTVVSTSTAMTTFYSTTTLLTTSTALSTTVRTETSVLNAETTVSTTSVLTYTSQVPVTQTQTSIETIQASAAADSTAAASSAGASLVAGSGSSSSSSSDSGKSLSTGSIVGIGLGTGLGAIGLISAALVLWRMRRKRGGDDGDESEKPCEPFYAPVGHGGHAPTTATMAPAVPPPTQMMMTSAPPSEPEPGAFTRLPRSSLLFNNNNRNSDRNSGSVGTYAGVPPWLGQHSPQNSWSYSPGHRRNASSTGTATYSNSGSAGGGDLVGGAGRNVTPPERSLLD